MSDDREDMFLIFIILNIIIIKSEVTTSPIVVKFKYIIYLYILYIYILLVCWQMWFESKEYTRKLHFAVNFTTPCQKCHQATSMIAIWTPYSDSLTP